MNDTLQKEFTEHTGHICPVVDPCVERYINYIEEAVFFHRDACQRRDAKINTAIKELGDVIHHIENKGYNSSIILCKAIRSDLEKI
jgi:hypothetical protein